ncbi:MAG: hypothetical protein HYT99_09420 [Candidatus Tectomicrobia bacterium]|nr:hypothetical protein [Candidatus Tectomicrobia bacterium]
MAICFFSPRAVTSRVVEIALLRYEAGREVACLDTLIDPLVPIPPEATAWVKETAERAGVPLQEHVMVGSFTDAATLSRSLPGGLVVIPLDLPRRFAHTPVEMFLEADLEAMSALVGALIRRVADGDFPAPGRDYKGRGQSAFG